MDARRLAIVAVLAGLLVPAGAQASGTQESIFMDDNLLLYRGNETTDKTIDELVGLGVDRIRVTLPWRAIAPRHQSDVEPPSLRDETNPADYKATAFDDFDHVIRIAHQRNLKVLLNVTGGAPLWATGTVGGHHVGLNYKPSPAKFAAFVEMLGHRYDGSYRDENQGGDLLPRVSTWSIWNEPNQTAWLAPQWSANPDGPGYIPYAPRLYRGLVRAAIAGLRRSGHADDDILLGETAPRGKSVPSRRGASMRPGRFLRALFCLGDDLKPLGGAAAATLGCDYNSAGDLRVSAYAHHPYPVVSPPGQESPNRDDIKLGDRARLYALLDAAAAAGRIPENLPVWFTEYGYQTLPPDPFRGVSLEKQALWNSEAEFITWSDSRVAAQTQFLLRDDVPRKGYRASDHRYWGTYQTGIEFADGRRKPAYDAYRLPFYAPSAVGANEPLRVWGFIRAGANGVRQAAQLQFQPDGSSDWRDVGGTIAIDDPRGYFSAQVTPQGSGAWRFVWRPPPPPTTANPLSQLLGMGQQPSGPSYASGPVLVRVAARR